MSILFSRQCEYALQAVAYLALKNDGAMTSIQEMTKALKIPHHFLAKILQDLTHTGLLVSQKGPTGGFALGMPASEMTLFHIIEAVDGVEFMSGCILGFPECTGDHPCAAHEQWSAVKDGIYKMLVGKSIAQVASDMQKPEYRNSIT